MASSSPPAVATDESVRKLHVVPSNCPCILLDCAEAFAGMTQEERLYAHHSAQASHEGSKICLLQTSHESPVIFALLRLVFDCGVDTLGEAAAKAGVSGPDFKAACVYAAAFFGNSGNYQSFGDTKIVPDVPAEAMEAIIKASPSFAEDAGLVGELWADCRELMYSLTDGVRSLGLGDDGVSTYYSSNCTKVSRYLWRGVGGRAGGHVKNQNHLPPVPCLNADLFCFILYLWLLSSLLLFPPPPPPPFFWGLFCCGFSFFRRCSIHSLLSRALLFCSCSVSSSLVWRGNDHMFC